MLQLSDGEAKQLPEGYVEEPIEISSRIFHSPAEATADISRVLEILQQMETRYGCKLYTNETTGMHVHVGNDGQEMPFVTVQRIRQLMTAHERAFDSIHTTNRILGPAHPPEDPDEYEEHYESPLFAPLSFFHREREHNDGAFSSALNRVRKLQQYTSNASLSLFQAVEQSKRGTMHGKNSTVNLDNLRSDYGEDMKQTVDFRQHTGTLDLDSILAYLSLLI